MNLKNGFTLFELLTIIAIAAILLLISIPAYQKLLPQLKLQTAAREITGLLRQAQQNTVTEQITYLVKFNSQNKEYQLIKREYPESQPPIDTVIETKQLDSDLTFSQTTFSQSEALFNTAGAVSEAGSVTISLTDGRQKTIEVRPAGFINIVE